MNERIKKLRKALGLTQQEFANRIHISRGALATYEVGRNEPLDAVLSLICREFNASENWLRTGEGEMFVESPEFSLDELARQYNATGFELKIVKKYFELPANIRLLMVNHFRSVFVEEATAASTALDTADQVKPKKPTPVSESGQMNADEAAFMRDVRAMSPGQQELLFNQYNRARILREQQKGTSTAAVPSATDDKAPESELPDQS